MQETELFEQDFWNDFIKSDDFKYLRNLLQVHADHLEKQVLVFTSKREFEKAYGYGERADECKKILQLVSNRLKQIKENE